MAMHSTLAPDDIVKACTYKDGHGKQKRPMWKDSPGGQQYWPSHNIAPASHTPVLVSSDCDHRKTKSSAERIVTPMKWGLTPSWHKGDPYKVPYETNNCRAEGMLEKKTYKVPLQKGYRCVVLADGYFEWKTTPEGKQPYFFYFPQPNGISYPGEERKPELNNLKEEKLHHETHFDKALKQESLLEGVKQEADVELKNNEFKIKQEISSDTDRADTHVSVSPDIKKASKIKYSKTEPVKSVWDTISSDDSEIKKEERPCSVKGSLTKIVEDDRNDTDSFEWKSQRLLTMAGLYDIWNPPDGSPPLYSYSVITVPAASDVSWCHHRMPAILSTEDEVRDWLDTANVPLQKASSLIKSHEGLVYHPVSKLVNNSRNKSADCIKPVELGNIKPKPTPSSSMMMNWLKSGSPAKKQKVN